MPRQKFKPFRQERDQLGRLLSQPVQHLHKSAAKEAKIINMFNNSTKTLSSYLAPFRDGSEIISYSQFSKLDVFDENVKKYMGQDKKGLKRQQLMFFQP